MAEMPLNSEDQRIRFEEFDLQVESGGRCSAKVVLAWNDDDEFVGTADGLDSQTGQLRCAANATSRALEKAFGEGLSLSVLGVKAIKAFDAVLVVVSLTSHSGGQDQRLVGSCMIDGALARGAALAVLSATNRLLANAISSR